MCNQRNKNVHDVQESAQAERATESGALDLNNGQLSASGLFIGQLVVPHYWSVRGQAHVVLLFLGEKLIVPTDCRKEMLDAIHESHKGVTKSKARSREILYWPGTTTHIEKVARCSKCAHWRRSNQKEPLIPHEILVCPWQKLGADVFEFNGKPVVLWIIIPNFLKSACSIRRPEAPLLFT